MSKLTSLIRRAPKRFSAVAIMIAAAIIIPVASQAWGPNRPTFTFAEPAPYVTFNSITDNPRVGDERNFVRIKEDVSTTNFGDNVDLTPGKVYEVSVYYHNNAKTSLNASGVGVAQGTKLRMELPAVVKSGVNAALAGNISATNANPGTVYDEAYGKNSTAGDIALRYVSGSATVTSNGKVNGQKLPDTLFTTGTNLGFDALDGKIPGCNEFAGYVTFKFRVDQPNFTIKKEVSTDGKTWVDDTVKAQAGSTIQYRVTYQNTGTNQQDSVSLRDTLPTNVSYLPGTSLIANSTTKGAYEKTIDGITTTGYNAGSYQPKGNVFFKFSAKIADKEALTCGTNTLKNVVRATTNAGYKEDTATVIVDKDCTVPPKDIKVCELATKKIITIKENAFDASKHSKNLDDCKEVVKNIKVCELATKNIITIDEKNFDATKHSKNLEDCKEKVIEIKVCELATKNIITINEKDFDAKKHSKNLEDCKTVPPVKIEVCELATKNIISIDAKDFDATKHSKNLADCKTVPPVKINVCELDTKKIITINEKDFDAKKHSKNLEDCKTVPPTKIEVCEIETKTIVTIDKANYDETKYTTDLSKCEVPPVTPPELPHTGAGENIVAILGLGSLVAGVAYYIASRRALGL
jgi:uncharacterized repeat protein (TIGR01451 family)/LPXTG-motif cell wall-anchored protein